MKAAEFSYACPATLDEALALMSEAGTETRPIAGGQSLMPMMNFRLAQPERLLDLNRVSDLDFIRESGGAVEIGAMTRMAELERSELVAAQLPLVAAAMPSIAHPAIRSRGTIGGSVALADPAAELPAILLALDARIHAVSQAGERAIDSQEFFLGPYETGLAENEIIRMISFPARPATQRFTFHEVARRHGDYAMAGVAVVVQGEAQVAQARVAFFGVCDRAVRAGSVEAALDGRARGDQQAVEAAVERVGDLTFNGDLNADEVTKQHLARVVLKRALAGLDG